MTDLDLGSRTPKETIQDLYKLKREEFKNSIKSEIRALWVDQLTRYTRDCDHAQIGVYQKNITELEHDRKKNSENYTERKTSIERELDSLEDREAKTKMRQELDALTSMFEQMTQNIELTIDTLRRSVATIKNACLYRDRIQEKMNALAGGDEGKLNEAVKAVTTMPVEAEKLRQLSKDGERVLKHHGYQKGWKGSRSISKKRSKKTSLKKQSKSKRKRRPSRIKKNPINL
jgi:hypothetical protein